MSTLLLRLAAPLQSWGADSKFERRGTERLPTKSGVIGLAAAALGRRRSESADDLRALKFGVRVDREGLLLKDFHTAKSGKASYVTTRYYLCDAVFLAGLEGDEPLLAEIDRALRNPMFPLFLGRRSCPPEGRVSLGIRVGKGLEASLRDEPLQISGWAKKRAPANMTLRISTDADETDTDAYFKRDNPVSFDQKHRIFEFRRVAERAPVTVENPLGRYAGSGPVNGATSHDAMASIGGPAINDELAEEANLDVSVADSPE